MRKIKPKHIIALMLTLIIIIAIIGIFIIHNKKEEYRAEKVEPLHSLRIYFKYNTTESEINCLIDTINAIKVEKHTDELYSIYIENDNYDAYNNLIEQILQYEIVDDAYVYTNFELITD